MSVDEAPWTPLATALRRFGKEFLFSHEHRKLVAEALASGKLDTRAVYMLGGEPASAAVPAAFWEARPPLWSTRQLRVHLVVDVQDLSAAIGLPQGVTDVSVEVHEAPLLELERLLKKLEDRGLPPSSRFNGPPILPATIEFGGRSSKHDWGELAAVAANWIADNGPGLPRIRLHRALVEHAEKVWRASPDRRDLDRWIIDIQATETGFPASSAPLTDAKAAALGKKGYASAAAIAGAWIDTHGLEAPKSQLVDYIIQWFVASHAISPSKQDVETLVSRVFSLAKAR